MGPNWGPNLYIGPQFWAPVYILGPNLGPNLYIGPQFGPQFNCGGPINPYLFILGPLGPPIIYLFIGPVRALLTLVVSQTYECVLAVHKPLSFALLSLRLSLQATQTTLVLFLTAEVISPAHQMRLLNAFDFGLWALTG